MKNIKSPDVTNLINSILKRNDIDLKFRSYIDLDIHSIPNVLKYHRTDNRRLIPEDKISSFLERNIFKSLDITTDRIFYQYLPKRSYVDEIKKTGCIRLYNLNKYINNGGDELEYRFFLESFGINFPKFEEQISDIKDNIFIWCLTSESNSKQHWEKFASGCNGVVLAVRFKSMQSTLSSIRLTNVCYSLGFLEEIQHSLKEKYNMRLNVDGYPLFAKCFKQKSFAWENETRLSFDNGLWAANKAMQDLFKYRLPTTQNIDNMFSVKFDESTNEKYILVPLNNNLFELEIIEIINRPSFIK
jgi:hypothetical protein